MNGTWLFSGMSGRCAHLNRGAGGKREGRVYAPGLPGLTPGKESAGALVSAVRKAVPAALVSAVRKAVPAALAALIIFCLSGIAAAASAQPEFWISPDGSLSVDAITYTKTEKGKYYLLLPANVNTDNLCFGVGEGVNFSLKGKSISSGDSASALKAGEFSIKINRKSTTLHVMTGSEGLPALYITTESGKLKYIESSKEHKEPGSLVFVGPKGDVQYRGSLEHIKTRGNSSMTFDKKNYQIKLENGTNLMGMGKAKKWILTGNYRDKSLIRNQIVYDLAEASGLKYTPEHCPAEVFINHEYRGLYLFSEKVEVDDDRVDIRNLEKASKEANGDPLDSYKLIGKKASTKGKYKAYDIPNNPEDISGGYLLEYESYPVRYKSEASAYTTKKGAVLVLKSPEYASQAQMEYISALAQSFENAINAGDGVDPDSGRHFTDIADLDSLALKYMIEELSENYDGNSSSQYFYKPDDSVSGKLFAGPVWDYDSAFGTYAQKHNAKKVLNPEALWIAEGDSTAWYPTLWKRQEFRERVSALWNERMKGGVEILLGIAGEENGTLKSIDEYAAEIRASAAMDRIRWPRVSKPGASAIAWTGGSFEENISFLKDYLKKRYEYLNTAWN